EAQSHEYEGVPMTVNFAAGPQTTQLWERVRPIVAQIEDLPFLAQLADGSLDVTAFELHHPGRHLPERLREGDVLPRREDRRPGRVALLGRFRRRGDHGRGGHARRAA